MTKNTSNNQRQTRSTAKKETREDFGFYIGIDLGDKHSDVCVLDQRGEVNKEFRLRMTLTDFQIYFAGIPRSRIAMEAGAQSRWVAELIEKCGHEVYVSNTRKVPYIHQSDDKDDPGDACKLAELLYFKPRLLHPVRHRSGDMYLRKPLVNCAHHILGPHGKDSDLRRFGQRIGARGGKNARKRAVIAVARKLAVLLHRLWISGEVYEPLRNSKQSIAA
jgi:transposase